METVTELPNRKRSSSFLHKLLTKFHHTSIVNWKPSMVKCEIRRLFRTLIQPRRWRQVEKMPPALYKIRQIQDNGNFLNVSAWIEATVL